MSENANLKDKLNRHAEQVNKLKKALTNEKNQNHEIEQVYRNDKREMNSTMRNYSSKIDNIKAVILGNVILNLFLLAFYVIRSRNISTECMQWFINTGDKLLKIAGWLKESFYFGIFNLLGSSLNISVPIQHLLTSMIIILLLIGLGYLLVVSKKYLSVMSNHKDYYKSEGRDYVIFKAIVTYDIACIVLLSCLAFYEPIKSVLPSINIFSVWLIGTLVGSFIWNVNDIISGFKY